MRPPYEAMVVEYWKRIKYVYGAGKVEYSAAYRERRIDAAYVDCNHGCQINIPIVL